MKKGNDGNGGESDLPLLPLSNGPVEPKLPSRPLLGDMGDPRVLQVLADGEKLRQRGYRKKKDLVDSGLLPEDSAQILLAGMGGLKNSSESGVYPFSTFLDGLQKMKYKGDLKEENYRALGASITASMEMTLEAAIKEKNNVVRAVYILLFFDLYTLRFRFSVLEQKLDLRDKSLIDKALEYGLKGVFFGLFKELVALLKDYFFNGDKKNPVDYVLDLLEEVGERYSEE